MVTLTPRGQAGNILTAVGADRRRYRPVVGRPGLPGHTARAAGGSDEVPARSTDRWSTIAAPGGRSATAAASAADAHPDQGRRRNAGTATARWPSGTATPAHRSPGMHGRRHLAGGRDGRRPRPSVAAVARQGPVPPRTSCAPGWSRATRSWRWQRPAWGHSVSHADAVRTGFARLGADGARLGCAAADGGPIGSTGLCGPQHSHHEIPAFGSGEDDNSKLSIDALAGRGHRARVSRSSVALAQGGLFRAVSAW